MKKQIKVLFLHIALIFVQCFLVLMVSSCNSCNGKKEKNEKDYKEPSVEELKDEGIRNVDSINPATIKPLQKGDKYVNINMHDNNGKKVTLARFCRGHKFTVVIFWTSWCDCTDEFHQMKDDYRIYKDKEVEFLGISLDKKESLWKNAVHQYGLPWRQFSDPEGIDGPLAKLYDVKYVPYTVVLDRDGKIVAHGITATTLDSQLDHILNKQ